jgi:small subunit ribosomal protein S20
MTKKQENKKQIKQNKRNKIINKRYTSTIKTLTKLFNLKLNILNSEDSIINKKELKEEVFNISNKLYSTIDKAVKKSVIHQNTANRKKAKIAKFVFPFQY